LAVFKKLKADRDTPVFVKIVSVSDLSPINYLY